MVSVEVATALHAAGVDNMLLKGPTFARWLYEEGEPRDYGDTDLLVPLDGMAPAETVLSELGFKKWVDSADQPPQRLHAHGWARHHGAVVDLHWTLVGVEVSAESLWRELTRRTETQEVAGRLLKCMDTAARALHVALHAAQHGVRQPRPRDDLRRALARCDEPTWEEAATLARRLEATSAFGTGLRLLPEGSELADRLALPPNRSVMVALRAEHPSVQVVIGIQSLLETNGVRGKAMILRWSVWPSARFMRTAFPRACRSRAGLVLAYVWRPALLLARTPGALLSVRRARRAVRHDAAAARSSASSSPSRPSRGSR